MNSSGLNIQHAILPRGAVHLYGFPHGNNGHTLPQDIRSYLGKHIRRITKRDYLIIEGTCFVPYPLKPPYRTKSLVYAVSQVPEIFRIRDLDLRTELPEWYLIPMFLSATDQKILEASSDAELQGVSPEDLALADEKIGMFRSLLVARAAIYRADALRGSARTFVGSSHAGEAKAFLDHPETIKPYLDSKGSEFERVYSMNESLQRKITDRFVEEYFRQCSPEQRPLALRKIVLDETERFQNLMCPGIKTVRADEPKFYLGRH